ncbi:MAG TPA: bifunctional YncE family protein/alkaline phosphatase family protein [Candidatus Baltobacteraceae bacterium]|nr:bifunctional YncE family protein/alkaline phosphatase family protein [Candidatus Baltobacteraceae bacterium]
MSSRSFAAAAMAAVLLGATHKQAPLIVYSAPAGDRPAGADNVHPTNAILPNGRIAAPSGASVFVGTTPLGMALSPDGRYVVVTNGDDRTGGLPIPNIEPPPAIGYSLAVVDVQTMGLVSVYRNQGTFFMGVATTHDLRSPGQTLVLASDGGAGAVDVFRLDSGGQLTPDGQPIPLPPNALGHAFPAGIAVEPNGRYAYVADNLGGTIDVLDLNSRASVRVLPAGNAPFNVSADGSHVLASAAGLAAYHPLQLPAKQPQFAAPAFDAQRSSVVSVIGLAGTGDVAGDPAVVRMDQTPDGTQLVGGAAPGSIVLAPGGREAYVALPNVDRVAVISLDAQPRVVRGLDLRLFPDAPFGAVPSGQAIGRDGKRLYVALAGLNAVAVLDARMPTRYRYGLIPTAWYPTALALSPDGRFLFVLNTKGVDGFGILQRVDLKHTSLVKTTLDTLRYNRTPAAAKFNAVIPPLRSNKRSTAIDHVVYVSVGTQTYDAILGDLKNPGGEAHGNGAENYANYPESVTPNLHALARGYALADNFYAPDDNPDASVVSALVGQPTIFTELTTPVEAIRSPLNGHGQDPEDYGRAGYLFNAMARAGLSYRDYGGLLRLAGYREGVYRFDVPALAGLANNVDLDYSGWDPRIDDAHRAAEFERDMQRFVASDAEPAFTYVWLPAATAQGGIAAADRALGAIVDYLSHTPHWSSTAIFIVPDAATEGTDHVNRLRSYALVVSPLARRGFVGHAHLSVPSVVKTEEEILGLQPLTLSDLLATDMADFFLDAPAPEPYQALH